MSSFFIANRGAVHPDEAVRRLRFTAAAMASAASCDRLLVVTTRVDAASLWGPARDQATGVRVFVAGRFAFDESEWRRAEDLPYEGGLAARLLLDGWLKKRPSIFAPALNGAGVAIVIDPRDHTLHLFTDRLGVFPAFRRVDEMFGLCSHPDVLADLTAPGGEALDETTVAEFLATGTSVQPFTYFRRIQQLEPASHYVWSTAGGVRLRSVTSYWRPAYLESSPSCDASALADDLSAALRRAIQRRTNSRLGRTAVMLSGGADSRTALFGAIEPCAVSCFTFYDEPNQELATAQRLADAAGARHHALKRDSDYYATNAAESVRISGGMWSLIDAHWTGFLDELQRANPGVLLTGCYADYLFKGLSFNRRYRKLFGKNLPLHDPAPFNFEFYQPHVLLREPWRDRVMRRLFDRFPQNVRDRYEAHRLTIEDLRLRPLAREADASGRMILWRTLPWDPILADNEVISVYDRISPELKLNGEVFGRAVGKLIGRAGRRIPNNNYGTPVDASERARAFWFLAATLRRKVSRLTDRRRAASGLATTGSWPNWSHYVAHSPQLRALWTGPSPSERDFFTDVMGSDPWQVTLPEWAARNPLLIMRMITARIWLQQRRVFA